PARPLSSPAPAQSGARSTKADAGEVSDKSTGRSQGAGAGDPSLSPPPEPGRSETLSGAGTPKSPVLLANVGTYSGPVGVSGTKILQGAQVWVQYINKQGGLNGHLVQFQVYDDGGDPARHRAQVQEAVERRHVLAFLMNVEVISGYASVEYL